MDNSRGALFSSSPLSSRFVDDKHREAILEKQNRKVLIKKPSRISIKDENASKKVKDRRRTLSSVMSDGSSMFEGGNCKLSFEENRLVRVLLRLPWICGICLRLKSLEVRMRLEVDLTFARYLRLRKLTLVLRLTQLLFAWWSSRLTGKSQFLSWLIFRLSFAELLPAIGAWINLSSCPHYLWRTCRTLPNLAFQSLTTTSTGPSKRRRIPAKASNL